jgi:hypothetical protein
MEERISLTSDRPPRPNSELVPSDPIWFLKSDHLSGSVCDLSARLCEHAHVPAVRKQCYQHCRIFSFTVIHLYGGDFPLLVGVNITTALQETVGKIMTGLICFVKTSPQTVGNFLTN